MQITSLVAFRALVIVWLVQPVYTHALGAIFHGKGTGVFVHNPESQNFLYSLSLNSENTFRDFQAVEVSAKPSNTTAVAVTGYGITPSVWASIFYQTTNTSLVQLILKCAMASGTCANYGEYLISKNVSVPVANNTKLAASLYLKDIGYRITYEDELHAIRQLTYANDTTTGEVNWNDGAPVQNYNVTPGYALATTYASPTNVSVLRESLYIVGDEGVTSLEATVANKNYTTNSIHDKKTWTVGIAIPILSLLNFRPGVTHIATIDYHKWQMGFYVDTDSSLRLVRDQDGKNWYPEPQQSSKSWPMAYAPNAPVAAVASRNKSDVSAYVYYRSGQSIIQAHIKDQTWQNATHIYGLPPTPQQAQQQKFERRIKIGAGSGASAGFIVLIILTIFLLHQRKIRARKARANLIQKQDSIYGFNDSVSGEGRFKAELHGEPAQITELDHDPECLLLHQLQARRLIELRGGIPREIDGEEMGRGELSVDGIVGEMCAGPLTCTCELDGRVIYEMACPVPELDGDDEMKNATVLKEEEIENDSIGGEKDNGILEEEKVELESTGGVKIEATMNEKGLKYESIGGPKHNDVLNGEEVKVDEAIADGIEAAEEDKLPEVKE